MLNALMRYGALTAKVRALYGKRLRLPDFEHMAALSAPSEVLDYLRTQPGWTAAVSAMSGSYAGRVELEGALRRQLWKEYLSLSHFAPREDKLLLSFFVLGSEQRGIMAALRRLRTGQGREVAPPEEFPQGRVDRKALAQCRDYAGLLSAVKGSIYYAPLLRLRGQEEGALPDYTATEALLRTAYFSHLYKVVDAHYHGETKSVLLRSFGEQVDLLNIIHILRLKTYFPGESPYYSVLLPFNYKLKPAAVRSLCAAPDAQAVFSLLKDTPYAGCFENISVDEVEDYYRRAFYLFNKKQLLTASPSIYTAVSYLNIKELEFQALVNVIESVKYGVPYDDSFARLIGET